MASIADRVRKHRAELRAQGFVPRQFWVLDMNNPQLRDQITAQCRRINTADAEEAELLAGLEAAAAQTPGWH
jgi:hypothetical protein